MIEIEERELDGLAGTDDGPVVMLNLLRFQPDGGWENYQKYVEHLETHVNQRYGLEVVYVGTGLPALVAEDGQAWDAVVLVRYPSRRAFVEMIRDPDYRAGAHWRSEALIETVLQPTLPLGA